MALFALIIGIIALVVAIVALLPVFTMIWGRPKLTIDLDVDEVEGGKVLECKIWNDPITNRLLKLLGVKRMPVDDLTAYFQIQEVGSDKILFPGHFPKIRAFSGIYAQRVSLPCSPIHASFGIVFKRGNNPVKLAKEDTKLTFGVGRYKVSITVIADYKGTQKEGIFNVSENAPYLYWSS